MNLHEQQQIVGKMVGDLADAKRLFVILNTKNHTLCQQIPEVLAYNAVVSFDGNKTFKVEKQGAGGAIECVWPTAEEIGTLIRETRETRALIGQLEERLKGLGV